MPQTIVDLHGAQVFPIHSAQLALDSAEYKHFVTFQPDYWLIVGRLSAGYIDVYTQSGKGGLQFRVDRGRIRLPFNTDTLSIQTTGATGWYSVYAICKIDGLDITG